MFRLAGPAEDARCVRPRGLRIDQRYRVYLDNDSATILRSGRQLMQEGLRVRLGAPMQSELLLFEAE